MPEQSRRLVMTPSGIAVLAQGRSFSGLPGEIIFGDPGGRSALYLQFPAEFRANGAPLRAFLTLDARTEAPPESQPTQVEAWRVRSAWQASALHAWSDKPELAPPYVRAAAVSPSRTLRIDVTEILRFAANNPELDHGIALIASGSDGPGARFSTGMDGDAAPRLEVYTR
jgi:hypothetical protein